MKKTNTNNSPYSCLLCNEVSYKNANGLVRHLKQKHTGYSVEAYFQEYITEDIFKKIAVKKILASSLPIKSRLAPNCFECGRNTCKFQSFGKGFSVFCSAVCANKNELHKKHKHQKTLKAIQLKYGVVNPSQIEGVTEKIKSTKKNRYGDERYNNTTKQKQTLQQKYGLNISSYTQTVEYKKKLRETSLSKYGVEHFTKSIQVKEKAKQTVKKRYGVEHTLQAPKIRQRIQQTCLKKYGVATPVLKKEVRELALKAKEANFLNRIKNYAFLNVEIVDMSKRTFKCTLCNHVFKKPALTLSVNHPRRYPRCLKCFPVKYKKTSLLQQELYGFLTTITQHNIEINNRKLLPSNKEVDFYIPAKKIAIEFNGNYFHSQCIGNKPKDYHLIKTEALEKRGIRLIHIFSDEWTHKKTIVKSKLTHLLADEPKKHNIVRYARKCSIKEISRHEANAFLNVSHLQGEEYSSNKRFGAFYNNELLAVMTFGKPRLSMGFKSKKEEGNKETIELIRFAVRPLFHIPGIGSKLLKAYIKSCKPQKTNQQKIISYADRRWSSYTLNNLYKTLGFKFVSLSKPNYFYLLASEGYKKRHNRFGFRKSQLKNMLPNYKKELTEWENMLLHKNDRIWDCGTIKYELNLTI